MVDTKPCACGCERTIFRGVGENAWNWKRRKYFDPVMCKRVVQVAVAKKKRKANRIADENFRKGIIDTSEFWQAWLCGRPRIRKEQSASRATRERLANSGVRIQALLCSRFHVHW